MKKKNNAPLPQTDEIFDRLRAAKFFSKLDLKTEFHQIMVLPEKILKTSFNIKSGQLEYMVMSIRRCNAPATFQTLMNDIFSDCIDIELVVYVDDLLILSSKTRADYLRHLEYVLYTLRREHLFVAMTKCKFMKTETDFLCILVAVDGIRVHPEQMRSTV